MRPARWVLRHKNALGFLVSIAALIGVPAGYQRNRDFTTNRVTAEQDARIKSNQSQIHKLDHTNEVLSGTVSLLRRTVRAQDLDRKRNEYRACIDKNTARGGLRNLAVALVSADHEVSAGDLAALKIVNDTLPDVACPPNPGAP